VGKELKEASVPGVGEYNPNDDLLSRSRRAPLAVINPEKRSPTPVRDTHLGPGIYDHHIVSTSKNTRATLGYIAKPAPAKKETDVHLGPGCYQTESKIVKSRATGGVITPLPAKSPTRDISPGPGSYQITSAFTSSAKRATLGVMHKPHTPKKSAPTPGPGSYEVSELATSKLSRTKLGYIKPVEPEKSIDPGLGPGQYNPHEVITSKIPRATLGLIEPEP
jgi:hypothetical protein